MSMPVRSVLKTVKGMPASDGAGVRLTRILGTPEMQTFDPFLMLDHFDTAEASDYVGGFPDHPHRGFETVTYMLEGKMRHGDNKGRSGVIETGGVQWMRAGRGIVHSEMPEQVEGRMRGFQLWVNLPSHLKMSEPDYQEFDDARIPVETREGGLEVKVITGETGAGTAGPVKDASIQPLYFDVTAPAGSVFSEVIDPEASVMVVVFEGAVSIGERPVDALGAAFLGEGDEVRVEATRDARFLLLAGRPIREPVAWAGPFVMNTRAELEQAFDDYRSGRF
jgi:redox-sensitive bicupin YhaK (pirin superfamily)